MTTARKRVAEAAYKIIKANPTGIRWADLHRAVRAALPGENPNTANGSLYHFRNTCRGTGRHCDLASL